MSWGDGVSESADERGSPGTGRIIPLQSCGSKSATSGKTRRRIKPEVLAGPVVGVAL